MKIYVATMLSNSLRADEIIKLLNENGHTITYVWTGHGQVFERDDLRRIGNLEYNGVYECDLLVLIQPGGAGSHVEFGVALGLRKPIIILEDVTPEQKSFYYLDNVYIVKTEQELMTKITQFEE